jgi:cytochrome c oxidase subunit III
MATFPTTAPIEAEPTTGHNGGAPPSRDGGDDGSFNYGAAAFDARLRRARLGMIVALSGIAMIFVSFTSAYFVRQGLPTLDIRTGALFHDWIPVRLPPLLLINTIVLLVSSITMALTRRMLASEIYSVSAGQGHVHGRVLGRGSDSGSQITWLAVTIALGLAFLGGQIVAWRELAASGFYLSTSPSSSFVYLLTATHGVHLLAGVLALLFAGAASVMHRPLASQLVIVDVTGWYWHFMAFLWLYIFCLLKFAH